ncbi:MAG: hypothetical protein FJY85_04900, partial [Deltaproteobacteria bacterium]|nr:hypothetical protein [Deltaproteobacteria bacterium]
MGFPCRTFSRASLWHLECFIREHRQLLEQLPRAQQDRFLRICAQISHLRSRKASDFFMQAYHAIKFLEGREDLEPILQGAEVLSSRSWALVLPYLKAAAVIPPDEEFFHHWILFARNLAELDIDVATTFVTQTPGALEFFGMNGLFTWAEIALKAVQQDKSNWKATKAFLEEAVADRCATSLDQWSFYLDQARRIAQRSPAASEEFIRAGARVCSLLNETETEQWVTEGLIECHNEKELTTYFGGTSLKALTCRDGLASGVTLKDNQGALVLLCEAFLGRPVGIRSNSALLGIRGFSGGSATDGRVIFLPDVADSFARFKLMTLHQAALISSVDWPALAGMRLPEVGTIHLAADRELLSRLPALISLMRDEVGERHLNGYPSEIDKFKTYHMPWWGDLLPGLVIETEKTIRRVTDELPDNCDVPQELLERLLATFMAQGERDTDVLLARITEMFDQIQFMSPDPEELEESIKTFLYKEWDNSLSDYKLDWCLVRQRPVPDDPNGFVDEIRERLAGIVTLIRRQFMRLRPETFQKFRAQPYGDDLDLDALVQAFVDMRAGLNISDSIYVRRDKRTRDVAVLFLVDLSASTNETIDGRRVIDVQKEAMALMCEALDCLGDPFAIYGFSSEGRYRVDLFSVKSFSEPYGEVIRYRLGNLEPLNLTRLGAAVRHGIYKLGGV